MTDRSALIIGFTVTFHLYDCLLSHLPSEPVELFKILVHLFTFYFDKNVFMESSSACNGKDFVINLIGKLEILIYSWFTKTPLLAFIEGFIIVMQFNFYVVPKYNCVNYITNCRHQQSYIRVRMMMMHSLTAASAAWFIIWLIQFSSIAWVIEGQTSKSCFGVKLELRGIWEE